MLDSFKKLFILRSVSEGGQKHKQLFKAIIFVAIIVIFFVNAKDVMAVDAGDVGLGVLGGVGAAVALILSLIAYILTTVIGLLITLVVAILIQVAQYGNIINVPTVIQGWVIVRDLCNMFFILILLIIAFATILRQENFSAKKLLPKLLIMAILINFSRTIFGLLVDFSQVIMLTFVNAFAAGGGWFIKAFRTDLLLSIRGDQTSGDWAVTQWSTAVAVIAGVVAAIITLIVVSVILAVLIVRIVMLWIYTIFSPLVFLGFALPALQKYTGKIWEDFIKQLIIGPVLAFFIWLALTTAEGSTDLLSGQNLTSGVTATEVCAGVGKFFCQGNFQKFIIVIGLLMGGLMVAQQMGGAAGAIAGKGLGWAKKSLAAPVGLAAKGGKRFGTYMETKAQEWKMPALTRGFWKGIGKRGDEERARAATLAEGKGAQLTEDYLHPKFWRKRKGAKNVMEQYERQVINKEISDLQKAMGHATDPRQEMQYQAYQAEQAQGEEGEYRRKAVMEMAAGQGNVDDVYGKMMAYYHKQIDDKKIKPAEFEERFGMTPERSLNMNANAQRRFMAGYLHIKPEWVKATELPDEFEEEFKALKTPEKQKAWLQSSKVQDWLNTSRRDVDELLKQSGKKEQDSLRVLSMISEVAKAVGHWEQFTTVKDVETGKYKILPEIDRLDEAQGEMNKREIGENLRRTATHVFRASTVDPKTGEFGRSPIIGNMGFFERNMSQLWKGDFFQDLHRSPTRMSLHLLGPYFDDHGKILTDLKVAQRRGFKDLDDVLKNAQEAKAQHDPIIFNAFYKMRFYGRKDDKRPAWDGTEKFDPTKFEKPKQEPPKDDD